jgi:two-component system nitrogen regulation response regulator GlnG
MAATQDRASRSSRVLVVDDDDAIRTILRDALREEGYDVCAARDGAEGRALISRWQPDVMVLDLRLPKVRGEVLARESASKATTVLISAEPAARRIADELGVPLVKKPFDLGELLDAVASVSDAAN